MKNNHRDVQYNPRMDSSGLTILFISFKGLFVNTFKSICFESFIICLHSETLLQCTF